MPATDPAQWPERLITLARSVREGDPPESERARAEFWLLVGVVLRRRTAAAAHRAGGLPVAELEDAVSDKLLDLLDRFDSRRWEPMRSHPGEIVGFLTTVARNAVVDLLRRHARRPQAGEDQLDVEPAVPGLELSREPESPESRIERQRFVDQLLRCAGRLSNRDRTIWRLRVLLELSSQEIADHPEVRLRFDHVNVILQRCRQRVKECMREAGLDIAALPRGTFATLWEATRPAGPGGET